MKVWIILLVFIASGYSQATQNSISPSFFVDVQGNQNCVIVVGEKGTATDVIEASRLAVEIGELISRTREIPVVEEVSIIHENIGADRCIVETPLQMDTLWYFDDFGVYGNGNNRFDVWETHEEIQLYIEDMEYFDDFLGVYKGNGYLDFSTIYRIDNVRSPPQVWVYSCREGVRGHITGLHYQETVSYMIVDPYFVYYGYLPEVKIFNTVYTVVYIDSTVLITGVPHLEYVYVYKDEPFKAGEYTISLIDVDVDHNKCYLRVQGPQVQNQFWMVLDSLHGFSSSLQEMSPGIVEIDSDGDGNTDHIENTVTGQSELDVWGHNVNRVADLVIDGIKTFIGENIGVYLGVYWVEDVITWSQKSCCDPFVRYPQFYDFQIRPERVVSQATEDAYVDEGQPLSNFGGSSFLSVRSFLNANSRSFVKFILPELPSKAIVSKAILRLIPVSVPDSRVYEVSRVLNPWSESAITWTSQPAVTLSGVQINNAMEWDVTADVQSFYSGTPNYGWRISDQSEDSLVLYEIVFGSKESFAKPQLAIEYTYDCNYMVETIPHVQNWINSFYDDVDNDGIPDSVYEIDISLCEPMKTECTPLFFEGPNYSYFVDFWNTSFEDGVDFEVYQIERVGTYEVKDTIPPWTLIKMDTEITEKDAQYNWILIGEVNTNIWIHMLVDKEIMPDDGSPVDWFMEEPGYKLYSDPLGFGNRIQVIAGKTSSDTRKAVQMFIGDITE